MAKENKYTEELSAAMEKPIPCYHLMTHSKEFLTIKFTKDPMGFLTVSGNWLHTCALHNTLICTLQKIPTLNRPNGPMNSGPQKKILRKKNGTNA